MLKVVSCCEILLMMRQCASSFQIWVVHRPFRQSPDALGSPQTKSEEAKSWKLRSLCIVAGGSGGQQLGETSCGKQSSCLGLESGKVFCDRMSSKSLREITLILHFATSALKLVYSLSILLTVHLWQGRTWNGT